MSNQKKPILEPKTQAFIDALDAQGGKPIYELSYEDSRKAHRQTFPTLFM